jgi:SAM-dependent methyltransferase
VSTSTRYLWKRESPFIYARAFSEKWVLEKDGQSYEFQVEITCGKKLDVTDIKKNWPIAREVAWVQGVMNAFRAIGDFDTVERCPVCSAERTQGQEKITIAGVEYLQCKACSHAYAAVRPTQKALERYYTENLTQNTYYTNPDEVSLRLREIYLPKLEWIVNTYRNTYQRDPRSILDFGAGAGHFLYGCKTRDMEVAGVEYSQDYREWCRKHFQIELAPDAHELAGKTFDVVCSFNVIEHVVRPDLFMADYGRFLGPESLAVVETPKFNSFTTCIQQSYPDTPRGHLVPYEHNHMFTDGSLATLLFENGLAVRGVWYFGQDMLELLLRICAECDSPNSGFVPKLYPALQEGIDGFRGSDLMLIAAVPLRA